tara:strand:+ start:1131 stop:1334 length:204 start_codon:yes stop_codon:yes gene_type:complete
MLLKLEDILDFSFLSIALILSMFIGKINNMLCFITFELISDTLSIAIQILVLIGLIHKTRKWRKKDV